MYEPSPNDELLTLKEAEEQYDVKRSTLHRYVQKGRLRTYRRGMDKRVYVRRSELEALRSFRPSEPSGGISMAAIERARAFQRRTFGDLVLPTPSAELIEEARNEWAESDIPWLSEYALQSGGNTASRHGDRVEPEVSQQATKRILKAAEPEKPSKTPRARPGLITRE